MLLGESHGLLPQVGGNFHKTTMISYTLRAECNSPSEGLRFQQVGISMVGRQNVEIAMLIPLLFGRAARFRRQDPRQELAVVVVETPSYSLERWPCSTNIWFFGASTWAKTGH